MVLKGFTSLFLGLNVKFKSQIWYIVYLTILFSGVMTRIKTTNTRPRRRPQQLPKVFIGSPYDKAILGPLRRVFNEVPFRVAFAKDHHRNLHLIEICRELIHWADYSIFDLSDWNPNVALELGMAEALRSKYFIILNSNRSVGVPSDIKGKQRLEFKSYSVRRNGSVYESGLWYELMSQIGHQNQLIGRLWDRFEDTERGNLQRLYASRILCQFKKRNTIPLKDLIKIWRGLGLSEKSRNQTVQILRQRNLIDTSSISLRQRRTLFPPKYKR